MTAPELRRCLLVDDDEAMRVLMRAHLEAIGAPVVTAGTAEDATALIDQASTPFAMVVADHRMPGHLSGFDVLDHARRHHAGTVLVLLSSHLEPHTITMADAVGAQVVDKADTRALADHWASREDPPAGGQ